jgi:hypothetical protein
MKAAMKRFSLIALLTLLSACKAISVPGFGTAADDIVPVPLPDARILFNAPEFAGQSIMRAKFADTWQREEYALFRGARSKAEVVYIAATARETSLDADVTLKSMIRKWNFNANSKIFWGEEIKALATFGEVFVLPYRHRDNSCMGFSSEWGTAGDDPEVRPTKMVFGYYCELAETPLTTAQIDALIDEIQVSSFAGGSTTSIPISGAIDRNGGMIGNPGFPFLLAQGYISEGRSFVDRSY